MTGGSEGGILITILPACIGIDPDNLMMNIDKKWLAIDYGICDNKLQAKRGTILFMYGIFSKEVQSKDVDVEYCFLAEPHLCRIQ